MCLIISIPTVLGQKGETCVNCFTDGNPVQGPPGFPGPPGNPGKIKVQLRVWFTLVMFGLIKMNSGAIALLVQFI